MTGTTASVGGLRRRLRRALLGGLAVGLAITGVGVVATAPVLAVDTDPDFMLIEEDLEHILKQIQIAEAHAAGGKLLCSSPTNTTGKCVPDAALPYGLRTVDGSFNNLLEPEYGAADNPFPRALPLRWRTGEAPPPGAPQVPGTTAICEGEPDLLPAGTTCYRQRQGFVYDSEPRVISNLIVDQTINNPAAQNAALNTPGSTTDATGNVFVPNTAPDEALSAPFNAWFTFFGQFFDHGLDLVNKGNNGTLVVPLRPDDPLYAQAPPNAKFLLLTRATRYPGPDGVVGSEDDVHNNQTTPFIDQNQTYTSHPSHQVFLREYELRDHDDNPATPNRPVDTGHLLDAPGGGLATWTDVKRQAREVLGIGLGLAPGQTPSTGNSDYPDVANVPQVDVDPYGNFIPGPNGFPVLQLADGGVREGNPASPVSTDGADRTNHAFLDDIAHGASLDPNDLSGYDNVELGEHFVTGDGRGNENIGLTSVHHIFHSEHNRMADAIEVILDKPGNEQLKLAFQGEANTYRELLGESTIPDGPEADDWTYEQRLFQAAKFPTEMQYQHLVFEEFARKIQPAIDPIVLNENSYDATINPAISAEFAHVVYRFGHSMLTEDIERNLPGVPAVTSVSLLDGFLNPHTFDMDGTLTPEQAAGAVVNGTTNQVGGQIDEHIISTLRNNLLGLPLDLATINIVRARDAGVPPLQVARKTFFEESGDPMLKPYDHWVDFGLGMKNGDNFGRESANPNASLVNFVAAYGKHPSITGVTTVAGKRAAADLIVNWDLPANAGLAPGDSAAFMSSTGAWANVGGQTVTGLEEVDFWIGGLAEALEPFGGMLGSTFNYVFEKEIEDLQFGDRFYYLFRNQGNQLFSALEGNSFAGLIQRNTDATLLPADIFAVQDPFIDLEALPTPWPAGLVQMADGTYRWDGDEHVEIHGLRTGVSPAIDDKIRAGQGDDALWGYAGNDRIEGGSGNDSLLGGPGNDVLTDTFGDDNIKGGLGNDALKGGSGDDLILGGHGHDYVVSGNDFKTVFASTGRDVVIGGTGRDTIFAGEHDDWIEGGTHADLLQGDNANQFQNNPHGGDDIVDGGPGNDDMEGEGGHDILIGRPQGTDRMEGMHGYDWVTYRGTSTGVDVDLRFSTLQRPDNQAVRDRFDLIEGVSGGDGNDVLRGMGRSIDDVPDLNDHMMTDESVDKIAGLRELLDPGHAENYLERFMRQPVGFDTDGVSNLLMGGGGSDLMQGRVGNDFLDGDAYLDVYVTAGGTRYDSPSAPALQEAIFTGAVDPGTIQFHREIVESSTVGQNDIAVFGAPSSQYTVTDLGDGYWSVAHDTTDTEPEEAEGTDILRNIEFLEFDDGCFVLGESLVPCGAFGVASLDYDAPATEDQPITARVVFDAEQVNDPTAVQFRWMMAEEEDISAAADWLATAVQNPQTCARNTDGDMVCEVTYRPGDLEVANLLRVEVTFFDDDGVLRSLKSSTTTEAVENVQDVPVPPVLSTENPVVGQSVRASGVQDDDGMEEAGETLVWIWQVSDNGTSGWTEVARNPYNVTGFVPLAAHVGKHLRVIASYTDDHGTAENATSLVTNQVAVPSSSAPEAPSAPFGDAAVIVGPGSVRVSWTPPIDDGGSPLLGYTVTIYRNGTLMGTRTSGPNAASLQVNNLDTDPALAYTFRVAARNSAGTGAATEAIGPVSFGGPPPVIPPDPPVDPGNPPANPPANPPTSTGGAPQVVGPTVTLPPNLGVQQLGVKGKPVLVGKRVVGTKLRLKLPEITTPGTSVRIIWKVYGKRIKGTNGKKVYKVRPADRGKRIKVLIRITRSGFEPVRVVTKPVQIRR